MSGVIQIVYCVCLRAYVYSLTDPSEMKRVLTEVTVSIFHPVAGDPLEWNYTPLGGVVCNALAAIVGSG